MGSAYNETLSASGGTAPYSYAVTAGALPPASHSTPRPAHHRNAHDRRNRELHRHRDGRQRATGSAAYSIAIAPATTILTSLSPTSGTTNGGTSVTLTGSGFTGATSVTFGGTAATGVTVVSDTTITATTPAHAAGAVAVAVTAPAAPPP